MDEKSVTNTSEFVSDQIKTNEPTLFEKNLETLGIRHRRTRPYSPWQNGKVERSYKIDGERFYSKQEFKSEEELKRKVKRYNARYNDIAKKVLEFKSSNQIFQEYLCTQL